MKRKIFGILFALVLALSLSLVMAVPVSADDISGTITYNPSGSTVGTYVTASSTVCTFNPTIALAAGNHIKLFFPAGTTITEANIAASDFTIVQAGTGVATAPSSVDVNILQDRISLYIAADSLNAGGLGVVTVATSVTAGGNEIRHPTTATTTGQFIVQTWAALVMDGGTINNVVFVADAANKLKITSAPLTLPVWTQGTVTVEVQDQFGNPQPAGAYTVDLASNSTGTYHFYTTGTQNVITSINIGDGASSGTFDYYDEKVGTPTITVTDAGAALNPDSQQQTITPAAANKLKITSAPLNQPVWTQGTVTVEVQDQYSNPQPADAYTVNLASDSSGTYHFYETGTQNVITSINIADGASSGTFDYYDEKVGTPTITVSDAGAVLTSDSQQQTINPAPANKLKITSAPLSLTAGTQGTVTVQVQDQYGNPQPAGAYTVNLASDSAGTYHFYTTGTQKVITSINIAGGASSGTFDYYDEKAGTPTITVSATGAVLTSDSQQQTINLALAGAPARPARFLTTYPQIVPTRVLPNQPVNILLNVKNVAASGGYYSAVLYIDGEVEYSQTVYISPGQTQRLVFTVYRETPGKYWAAVDGYGAWFTVAEAAEVAEYEVVTSPPPPSGGLGTPALLAIILGSVGVGVAIFFATRPRAT
jgi:hypothetical protein